MNPEPFNDLSWNDDPLHSPNRTIYIERLRARVKELEGDNAHMLQVIETASHHGHEDGDETDCSLCAAVKTVLDRAHPGQTLLDKLTALEKERDQLRKENDELWRQILGLQLEWKKDSDQMVKSNLAANRAFSHYKTKCDSLEKEVVELKENLRNTEAEFLESGDKYRDQIMKLIKERDQLKGEVDASAFVNQPVPTHNPDGTLTVKEAQKRRVCRICQKDNSATYENPLLLKYGKEYAHKNCLIQHAIATHDATERQKE